MSILSFINVNQGDCCILRPTESCKYSNKIFYIDLGDGMSCDITKYINSSDEVNIVLSHHHEDHIGGLRYFFNRIDDIKKIILPSCQNEIILIANAILNLKGINDANNCQELIDELKRIVYNHLVIKTLFFNKKNIFNFIFEGYNLCDHIECLNPPKPFEYNDIRDKDRYRYNNELDTIIYDVFNATFAHNIEEYFKSDTKEFDNKYNERITLDEIKMDNILKYQDIFISNDLPYHKNIVANFIKMNVRNFKEFNEKKNRMKFMKIYNKYKKYTHDFCIVLKAKFDGKTMLLTGDASKKVFYRLIDRNDNCLKSDYLKMPHHGSKDNIDKKIINAIDPRFAIISHKNGKFGKSKDTHPNSEVIELLEQNNITILLTNDVIKNGNLVRKKQKHCDCFVEIL